MYAHVGGLTKRVNVLSKQDELSRHACTLTLVGLRSVLTFYPNRMSCFLQACTRNRERHTRGNCLLITRGSVMPVVSPSALSTCDRCTPCRASSSPRVLQEAGGVLAGPACLRLPLRAQTPSSLAVVSAASLCGPYAS